VRPERAEPDALIPRALEVHVDATRAFVVDRAMLEGRQVEIAAELPIDALQQVLVESSGHPAASS
jgi:hypothetical protein